MGISACTRAPPHFGSATCMVDVTVGENQMPDIGRVVSTLSHSREYFFSFIRPSRINHEQRIIRLQEKAVDHAHLQLPKARCYL